MRSRSVREAIDVDRNDRDGGAGRSGRGRVAGVALAALRRPRDTLAALAATAAVATILINALFLQPGPHPAPIFALKPERPLVAASGRETTGRDSTGALSVLPRPRPADAPLAGRAEPAAQPAKPAARPRPELVTEVQRELSRRGYYDGPIDGLAGSKTEAAIREFEHAAGLPATGEASDAILKAIARAPVKLRAAAAPRHDPIAGLIAQPSHPQPAHPQPAHAPPAVVKASAPAATASSQPPQPPLPVATAKPPATPGSAQIRSVQRALADYGYGQVRPTGVHDTETRAAIESFEQARRMPVTGQVSDRLVRELTALTGRSIE
ncbi:hypothetical protein RHODGE_RHODGE_04304 [Rhodoplanes serenus]|uniref:Peptidoglycan binding-like domain-containing protein n=1 Tax=Rhodoplanes serenus TaxID=200615 RepID=A0A3S4FCL2_9BRAD|nr:hypothetical protein RHODGE_RHODGE_04304 [Rhodoplanes serenus]